MADQFGLFWNSINSDRTYDADSFAEWLRKFFTTGIFNGEMQVTPGTGMQVNVAPGYANLNGKVRFFDAAQTFTLDPASGTYPRIDTIVVRSDSTNRIITTEYVKGAYSGASPVPTAPVRTSGIYEIVLAQILVGAGITAIMAQDITDTRPNDELCGWVTSTVEGVPMGQIVAQMQADFLAWYDRMKGQLSEDAAGHLQSQIDSTNQTVASLQDQVDTNVEYFDGRIDNVNDTVGENTDAIIGLRAKSESALYAISRYFEPSSTAITSHVEGEYFLWQYSDDPNQVILVRTINYIGTGNRIAEGINVAHTSVGEALDALNNGLSNIYEFVEVLPWGTYGTVGQTATLKRDITKAKMAMFEVGWNSPTNKSGLNCSLIPQMMLAVGSTITIPYVVGGVFSYVIVNIASATSITIADSNNTNLGLRAIVGVF